MFYKLYLTIFILISFNLFCAEPTLSKETHEYRISYTLQQGKYVYTIHKIKFLNLHTSETCWQYQMETSVHSDETFTQIELEEKFNRIESTSNQIQTIK
ncbi:MAG: hypothetical protein P4L22_07795 [Candidatus Babeliales bacterium]|nr:hypothetical protein [Candidatus Babeliales bacterium]